MKWFFFLLAFASTGVFAKELTLPVYVFEITPLIYQNEKKEPVGFWFESFEKLSHLSKVKFDYHFVSVPRMELLLSSNRSGCNLTLLKTKNRIKKNINFISEHPVDSVFKAYKRADDPREWTFEELSSNKYVKIVTNTPVATEMLKEKKIESELLFNIDSIIHMLIMKRIDLFVGSNLAIERSKDFISKKIVPALVVKTIPHGIGCSRGTPPEIISALQNAAKSWVLD